MSEASFALKVSPKGFFWLCTDCNDVEYNGGGIEDKVHDLLDVPVLNGWYYDWYTYIFCIDYYY